jgi:DNA-binding NarL/FixJ family response regulator
MQTILYLEIDPTILADLLRTLSIHGEVLAIRAGQDALSVDTTAGMADEATLRMQLIARGLTPRQCDLVILDVQGHSRAEIAEICGVSSATVKKYWASIYRHLHVKSRPMLRSWLVTQLGSTRVPEQSTPASEKPAF